jgi:hypothetical protein
MASASALLRLADEGSGRRLVEDLQVRHGNAAVARLMAGDRTARRRPGYVSTLLASIVTGIGDLAGLGDEPAEETEAELPIPTKSGTTINVVDAPFDVSGSFLDVANELAARTEAGSVTSFVSDVYLEPLPGPVKLASITVDETRSLPRWKDRPQASEPEKREWDRFMSALTAHENAHVALDKTAFKDIHKRCRNVMEETANARVDAAILAADEANAEFDAQTRNGRAAGTVIDSGVAGRSATAEE